jgi:hypothetical protein
VSRVVAVSQTPLSMKNHKITGFWDKTYHLISTGRLLKVGFDRTVGIDVKQILN